MVGGVDARFAPTQQRIHSRQQLGKGEGLDQIIVGAVLQPFDAVADRGRADRIRTGVSICAARSALSTDSPSSTGSMRSRMMRSKVPSVARNRPSWPLRRLLDAMALLREALGEIGGRFAVILDQQDLASHGRSVKLQLTSRGGK